MPDDQRYPVVADDTGLRRLDPPPTESDLAAFYEKVYYSGNEGRAPDIERLRRNADAARDERAWREATVYADVLHYLTALAPDGGRVVDVGCGTGEFVLFMQERAGWTSCGVELAPDAVALASDRGAIVGEGTIDSVREIFGDGFDALAMFNVLEHLLDPWAALGTANDLLRPGGVLIVQVPNDFSVLQEAVRDHLDAEPWWVAIPDHVNYFDFESLEKTLRHHDFVPRIRYGSFPMEFFLLGGYDYVNDPATGSLAHRSRCAFEMSMDGPTRRTLFEGLAAGGLGRNALIVATKEPSGGP
ncbi:MAG: class I SAM-dependent methyltransferase [Actinomycetota bacterium]